jgi:hypothetical protein
MSSVKIAVTLLGRSDLAILVSDGQREAWVPLSQIEEEIEEPTGSFSIVTTTAIVVPDWVAREKGLQQVNQDDRTMDMFGDGA